MSERKLCISVSLQLYKADPKPKDAMQFIGEQLYGSIDADEFRNMKENLSKLTEDLETMKAGFNKMQNMMTKFLPEQPMTVDEQGNTNKSLSMENNIGDSSHISMLDDSSLVFEQTLTNMQADERNDTTEIDGANTSQVNEDPNESAEGFTMEYVELDVVDSKGSLDTTIVAASDSIKTEEDMQFDDIDAESVQTSTPEPEPEPKTEPVETTEKLADAGLSKIKIDELPIVLKEDDCENL